MDSFKLGGVRKAFPVAFLVVLIDQLTKSWAVNNLLEGSCSQAAGACKDFILGAQFHLIYNRGAAFSLGESFGRIFAVLALLMTIFLLVASRSESDRYSSWVYGLLAGGAFGNFIDRAFRSDDGFLGGGVVDFIDFGWWPIFNIADSAIMIGVFLLLLVAVKVAKDEKSAQQVMSPEDVLSNAE